MDTKKDVGVFSSAPIPAVWPSHCPFSRISNASQPTSSNIIISVSLVRHRTHLWQTKVRDIILPRRRFVALLLYDVKVAKFELADSNVRKRLFLRPAQQTASSAYGSICLELPSQQCGLARSGAKIVTFFWKFKFFMRKNEKTSNICNILVQNGTKIKQIPSD